MNSLFDEPEPPRTFEWYEIPAHVYLSMSEERLLECSVAWDLDSAAVMDDLWLAEFFLARARDYQARLDALREKR